MSAEVLLAVVRSHWDIENGLHWQLDVVFEEDDLQGPRSGKSRFAATLLRNTFRADRKRTPCAAKCCAQAGMTAYLFQLMSQMR